MRLKTDVLHALMGATVVLLSSYLVAVLFAYTFRVPIPLAGYYGPFGQFSTYDKAMLDVFSTVLSAWMFYGLFGGFIILIAIGSITGVLVGRNKQASKNRRAIVVLWSVLAGAAPVFLLAVLDYMIGPW